jgi:DNA-binding MarR family transcriptional regulator
MVENLDGGKQGKQEAIGSGEVVGALSAVLRAEHRHAAFLGPAMDLGLNEVMALYHLANEPLTAGALHDRVGLSTGSVTALVDRLAEHGLVQRQPHPTDRRAIVIDLTEAGRARTFATLKQFIVGVEQLGAALSPAERLTVLGFLQSLEAIIDTDTTRLRARRS